MKLTRKQAEAYGVIPKAKPQQPQTVANGIKPSSKVCPRGYRTVTIRDEVRINERHKLEYHSLPPDPGAKH